MTQVYTETYYRQLLERILDGWEPVIDDKDEGVWFCLCCLSYNMPHESDCLYVEAMKVIGKCAPEY